jgi:hypothetical protein
MRHFRRQREVCRGLHIAHSNQLGSWQILDHFNMALTNSATAYHSE